MKNTYRLLFAVAVTSTFLLNFALPVKAGSAECVSLTQDLSYGLQDVYTNGEIAALQQFLINQGFLTSISVPTGYFGYATQNAVASYQNSYGLSATGSTGSLTRASIEEQSCGSSASGGPAWIIGGSTNTNTTTTACAQGDLFNRITGQLCSSNNSSSNIPGCYSGSLFSSTTGQSCYSNYNSSLSITNVNAPSILNVGVSGAWTFTVNGFSSGYVTTSVRWGDEGVYYASSSSPQSAYLQSGQVTSFTHTYQTAGVFVPVFTVTDSSGKQGSVSQTVTVIGGTNYYGIPIISSITPNSATAGSTITIYGSGFGINTPNTIYFGTSVFSNRYSSNGTSLNLIVPDQNQTCPYQGTCGTFSVSVTNAQGQSSNSMQFTVIGNSTGNAPSISGLTGPTSLAVGTSGIWSLVVNTTNATYLTTDVRWGDESYYGGAITPSSTFYIQDQQTRTFSHIYQTPGFYTVIFTATDSQGRQSTSSVTVTVTGSSYNGQTTLSYLSPSQGHVGTQIMIQGSGFSTYGNTVHFGIGGSTSLYSTNSGSTIYYTIPSVVTPCDTANGSICSMIAMQVTAGSYPVYVTNSSGQTTNTVYFGVTQ